MPLIGPAQAREIEHVLAVLLLVATRLSPSAWCLTWILRSFLLRIALGIALSLCLLPFALRIAPAEFAIGSQLWAAIPWELARGAVLGLGTLLPVIALSWVGRLHDGSRGALAGSEDSSPLECLYGAAAIALLFATGSHALVFRALAGSLSELPLGAASVSLTAARPVSLELAKLVARAFELSIVLAAPVLTVILTSLAIAATSARISTALSGALLRGPLLPVVGLSAACLSISSILGSLPQALSVFVQKAVALLTGLH